MKIKKKEVVFLLCIIFLVLCLGVGFVTLVGQIPKKQAKKAPVTEHTILVKKEDGKAEKEEKKVMEFENFHLLESVFMLNQVEDLQQQISEFLARDKQFNSLTKVSCKEAPINTEKKVEFYCLLREDTNIILRVAYNKTYETFRFWTEEKSTREMEGEWEAKQEQHINTTEWETEEELPREWTYVEEDKSQVSLKKKERLNEKIPSEALKTLESEIQVFFNENHEFRRELEVQKDVKESAEWMECVAKFKTPRIDKKELHIQYDKVKKTFQFTLQEE